jgi:hypothetical protein
MVFMELSKLGGIPGWLLSAAIASSVTVVMGYAAAEWFQSGKKLSKDRMTELTRKITKDLLDSLKSLGKKKPSKEKLQEAVKQSLEEITLDERKD